MSDSLSKCDQLFFAAQEGDLAGLQALIAEGVPVNTFEEDLGWTPLHAAAKNEHLDIVACLIEHGADVNARDEAGIGETPLGLVAQECSFVMARLLVDAGADPTIPGWMQITALHRAANRKRPEGVRVYELLREAVNSMRPPVTPTQAHFHGEGA